MLALAVSACGGGGTAEETREPTIPAEIGESLAAQADEVAALLAAGDLEGARAQATALRDAALAARDAGEIRGPLARRLLSATERLLAAIPTPAPPVEEEDEEDDPGKGKGKGKGEGKGKGKGEGKGGDKGKDEDEGQDDELDETTSTLEEEIGE